MPQPENVCTDAWECGSVDYSLLFCSLIFIQSMRVNNRKRKKKGGRIFFQLSELNTYSDQLHMFSVAKRPIMKQIKGEAGK